MWATHRHYKGAKKQAHQACVSGRPKARRRLVESPHKLPTALSHMTTFKTRVARSIAAACASSLCAITSGCGGGGADPAAQDVGVNSVIALQSKTTSLPLLQPSKPSTNELPAVAVKPAQPAAATVAVAAAIAAGQPAPSTGLVPTTLPTTRSTASSAIADWLPNAQPPVNGVPTALLDLVKQPNIIAFASPNHLFPMRNIGLQCQGADATLADVAALRQQVNTNAGHRVTRFGVAGSTAKPVFRLELDATDVLPAGTQPRCELLTYPMPGSGLPVGETFWLAFSIWVDDWTGSTDEQSIGQMHIQDARNIALNPFLGLVVRGKELSVELRHNPLQTPSQASTTLVKAALVTLPTRRWFTIAIRARMETDPAQQPFFQMWLDDRQIVDYSGPWGYMHQPDSTAYAKVGIYHWLNGNPWDTDRPTRSVMLGSMLLARDKASGYSHSELNAAVAPPVQ